MQVSKTLLALGVAAALLVGCKKQDEAAAEAEPLADDGAKGASRRVH